MKLSFSMLKLATSILVVAALALTACGDSGSVRVESCGDGLCSSSEDEATCPRDCPFVCAPFTVRCDGNVQMICTDDGLGETAEPCAADQACTENGCVDTDAADTDLDTDSDVDVDMGADIEDDTGNDTGGDDVTEGDASGDAGDAEADG